MGDVDKANMRQVIEEFSLQIEEATHLGKGIFFQNIEHIVVAGMGGSALPGAILKTLIDNVPVTVIRDYSHPFITANSLVFIVSYSGNTEETISLFHEFNNKTKNIVAISAGGQIEQIAKTKGIHHIKLPGGMQPRMSVAYFLAPMLNIIEKSNIMNNSYFEKVRIFLENQDRAKSIAAKLKNKIPLIYSTGRFACVAYKWKININENAKTHAFFNLFPECNHNEINGFVHLNANFHVILIRDGKEHDRNLKRFRVVKKLIEKQGVEVTEVILDGESHIEKILNGINIGDWTSYFLAIENATDPTPVKIIEELKIKLRE